jgi:hypothetical protein
MDRQQKGEEEEETEGKAESEKQEWLRRERDEPWFYLVRRSGTRTTSSVATTNALGTKFNGPHKRIQNLGDPAPFDFKRKALNPFCPIRRHCVELGRHNRTQQTRHKTDAREEKSG